MDKDAKMLDRATAALLKLAGERDWRDIGLRAIAEEAGIELGDLYRLATSRESLLGALSARFDQAALETAKTKSEDVHDRLFDAVMARVEVMEPHRAALTDIVRAGTPLAVAGHLPKTARAILEAAGVVATPLRVVAMTAVWARTVQVWRDDEGALNRTMAEIDKRLRQMRQRLKRFGAGF